MTNHLLHRRSNRSALTMRTIPLLTCVLLLSAGSMQALIDQTPSNEPSAGQQAQIARKYGMFCHFGINTYANQEWTDGSLPPQTYAPPADLAEKIDGWVKTAHDAGMRYFLCITKHHDGFCMWKTKATDYCVFNPAIKNQVDVVKAVSDACRKYHIGFAVYYSLWDRHEPSFPNPKAYRDFMLQQLTELMSNYGPVCELWLDGGWGRSAAKDWYLDDIYSTVKKLQPDCQIATNHTIGAPDNINAIVPPAEQKEGYPIRFFPSDFRLKDPALPGVPDPKHFTHDGKSYYLPFEATVTVSAQDNWFAHPSDRMAKSAARLEDIFYAATAQDNLLVFNIPPDKEGNLIPAQVESLMELAKRLGIEGGGKPFPKPATNLCLGAKAEASAVWQDPDYPNAYSASRAIDGNLDTRWACAAGVTSATLDVDFGKPVKFNRVVISEYANRINSFALEIPNGSAWKPVYSGTEIGEGQTINIPETNASQLRLDIKEASAPPSIYEIKVLNTAK